MMVRNYFGQCCRCSREYITAF